MAWQSIPVFTVATLTVAVMNIIRDDLLTTPAALASVTGQHFVANGPNSVVARRLEKDNVNVIGTKTSATYTSTMIPVGGGSTSGPSVTVATNAYAEIFLTAFLDNTGTSMSWFGYDLSGATTLAASDSRALGSSEPMKSTLVYWHTGLLVGTNIFESRYKCDGGTMTGDDRTLGVLGY